MKQSRGSITAYSSLALMICFSFLAGLCFASPMLPPENRTILVRDSAWVPTGEQTQKALEAAYAYIESFAGKTSPDGFYYEEAGKVREHFAEYCVQFIGVEEDGRKVIRCNFFRKGAFGHSCATDTYVEVMDGGFWFWQIDYDVESGRCLHLSINGYA